MPDEFDWLAEDSSDGMVGVVVTIRPGKNNHAEFHLARAPARILTHRPARASLSS